MHIPSENQSLICNISSHAACPGRVACRCLCSEPRHLVALVCEVSVEVVMAVPLPEALPRATHRTGKQGVKVLAALYLLHTHDGTACRCVKCHHCMPVYGHAGAALVSVECVWTTLDACNVLRCACFRVCLRACVCMGVYACACMFMCALKYLGFD
jgi:hypothetical protein